MGSFETTVVGAILAGGESRRLGRDKALLPWSGKPLILHPYDVLQEVMAEVVAVSVPGRGYEDLGVRLTHDRFEGQGPLAGLHAALEWARPRPVFVVACDLPFVSAELVTHVAGWESARAAFHPQGEEVGCQPRARVAEWAGRRQPLCGLYSPDCRQALEDRLREGRLEAWRFLDDIETTAVPITPALEFYRDDLLLNLNSLEDLHRAAMNRANEPAETR